MSEIYTRLQQLIGGISLTEKKIKKLFQFKNKQKLSHKYHHNYIIIKDITYIHSIYADSLIECNVYKDIKTEKDQLQFQQIINEHKLDITCNTISEESPVIVYLDKKFISHILELKINNITIYKHLFPQIFENLSNHIELSYTDFYTNLYKISKEINNKFDNNETQFHLSKEILYICDCVLLYYEFLNSNNKIKLHKFISLKHNISKLLIVIKSKYISIINNEIPIYNTEYDYIKTYLTIDVLRNNPRLFNIAQIITTQHKLKHIIQTNRSNTIAHKIAIELKNETKRKEVAEKVSEENISKEYIADHLPTNINISIGSSLIEQQLIDISDDELINAVLIYSHPDNGNFKNVIDDILKNIKSLYILSENVQKISPYIIYHIFGYTLTPSSPDDKEMLNNLIQIN